MMSKNPGDTHPFPSEDPATLHELELGAERVHRAHGHLIAFHHNIGRGMDHIARAEDGLRAAGRDDLADELRDEYLPRGVIPRDGDPSIGAGRWSYDVLEAFQRTFYRDIVTFVDDAHEELTDGHWHVHERAQERQWKDRSEHR